MTTEQIVSIVKALTELLGVLLWPAIILYVLKRFSKPLSEFFSNLSELSFKAPGMEATLKGKQVEAAAAIGAAVAVRTMDGSPPEATLNAAKAAASAVTDAITPRTMRRLEGATVLWVDDQPANNQYERQALEALGMRIVLSTSTDDALLKTQQRAFDAIISDMGRPPDARAGYTLLDALRARGDQTPFIIYASSRAPEHVREAREHGAIGCTNQPNEFIEMVLSVMGQGVSRKAQSA
jgi:CheY-like chemotaxis protein